MPDTRGGDTRGGKPWGSCSAWLKPGEPARVEWSPHGARGGGRWSLFGQKEAPRAEAYPHFGGALRPEVRRGQSLLATAKAGVNGLYELPIKVMGRIRASPSRRSDEDVRRKAWAEGTLANTRNLLGSHTSMRSDEEDAGRKTWTQGSTQILSHIDKSERTANFACTKADIWHQRLGHSGATMMRKMLPVLLGHNLCTSDAEKVHECTACIQGKLARRPAKWTLPTELLEPLHRLQGDICGPINPKSGPFSYFLVLVDAPGRHAEVSLLTTRNMVFPKLLAMILKYRNHFLENTIKYLRVDNALEFRSHTFEDFCVASGIEHVQNRLAEAYIKKIQLVTRPLLFYAKLPSTMWGYAILHAAVLLRLRPTLLHNTSPLELMSGRTPNISHLRTFGCEVWVPTAELKQKTITLHREKAVYLGYDSPSIIRYMLPGNTTIHKAQFEKCRFIENSFPAAIDLNTQSPLNFRAIETLTSNPDPRTFLSETEVKKMLNLRNLTERLPDRFAS